MPPIIVTEFEKNGREVVRVELSEFHGTPIVNVRVWFRAAGGELRPSRAGIAMSVRHLSALANGLAAALDRAGAEGLMHDEDDAS